MANRWKQRMSFQQPAVLCQDACQHLMLHPYITASRTAFSSKDPSI